MFEREDWKLFRNLDTLCQKAGVNRRNIPKLIIKELVDNALDVSRCELKLTGKNGFSVRDYGDGFDEEIIANLFSINRPMITSKMLRLPTRGALGNGLRVVTGAIMSTNGELYVETRGKKYRVLFGDDGSSAVEYLSATDVTKGTRFTVELGSYYEVTLADLVWGEDAIIMSEGPAHSCRTSPYWYTSEAFFELLTSYRGSLGAFLAYFDRMNEGQIEHFGEAIDTDTENLTFDESEEILSKLRSMAPMQKHKKLGSCGEYRGGLGTYAMKCDTFRVRPARGRFSAEIPYVVEAWLRQQDTYAQQVYVNKTPITGEYSAWYDKGTMRLYRLGLNIDVKFHKCQIVVNVITPYMPITSDGKSPDFSSMNDTIQKCLNAAKTKEKKASLLKTEGNARNEKEITFHHMQSAIDKASGQGHYRFSQRQLYYAMRPHIMAALDKQSDYTYFCRLLTEYENEYGDIRNLYRDPRGVLYHPHLGEEIPLGTIAVQNYERPKWTFNKILYSEKEGFFPILKDAKFPERYDCALLTSKGYASRAVKDLFDLLGDTDEEILFFCIHDADAAGTMIYQTLQEETISRPGRRVKIINLGLNPWDALDMGLEVETFDSKGNKAVARHIKDKGSDGLDTSQYYSWESWLQKNRVELNAMTTPVFIAWLEYQLKEYDNGKVIPHNEIIEAQLRKNAQAKIRQRVMDDILCENGFEQRVDAAMVKAAPLIEEQTEYLDGKVKDALSDRPEEHWTQPVDRLAGKIAEEYRKVK